MSSAPTLLARPRAGGKFLFSGSEKLLVRGVTYGPFPPAPDGGEYRTPPQVEGDFAAMAAAGINAVRTYTPPPRWLLDLAGLHRLRVMVGLPWEQHIAFLDDARRSRDIMRRARTMMRTLAGHPALLAVAIGNEIPAAVARWHGAARVEGFLRRLYEEVKDEDPEALVTYVNYPTTEYLHLPFLDLVCFNVYLEERAAFEAYLARLHNLAHDRPLLLAEIGLDSRRNGEKLQARAIEWQVRTGFAAGVAGAFVFSWSDAWHRGGQDIEDWDFGLVRRDSSPKLALQAVKRAYAEVPFAPGARWPSFTVVVCTYNGSRTIRDCMEGLKRLDYPLFDVVVVDDGSTDATATIAAEYNVRLIRTPNRGLSSARNTGLAAATSDIVAYLDDDAWPDPHWLQHLAAAFLDGDHAAVGGPNIPPPGDGAVAECVAHAPGGPVHVLLTDREAEHIPGCNMAFRRARLKAISGFDPQFRCAGDDVDVCWRLLERGDTIGFAPAAMVWHRRRNSVHAYWRQQVGYGKAEAMLERKWPGKYNPTGHVSWGGRLYGNGLARALIGGRSRIYQGTWGTAPFQPLYTPSPGTLAALTLVPEWYLAVAATAVLSLLGLLWTPLLVALPLLLLTAGATVAQAVVSAGHAQFPGAGRRPIEIHRRRALTVFLHLMQPLARLVGRLKAGLHPLRRRQHTRLVLPWTRQAMLWSETWCSPGSRLAAMEERLEESGVAVSRGSDYDAFDLHVPGGVLAGARALLAVEDHGQGRQLARLRVWPRWETATLASAGLAGLLAVAALWGRSWSAAALLGSIAALLAGRALFESGAALGTLLEAFRGEDGSKP